MMSGSSSVPGVKKIPYGNRLGSAPDGMVDERREERRFANEVDRELKLFEEFEAEKRLPLVVLLNSLQHVSVSFWRQRRLRTSHRELGFETANSISRRTSDQGRADPGLAKCAARRSRISARCASETGSWC